MNDEATKRLSKALSEAFPPAPAGWTGSPVASPGQAAELLQSRGEAWYEPGDGTRYDLVLVERARYRPPQRYLLFKNFKGATLDLNRGEITAIDYVLSLAPVGGWAAIRPVLYALGIEVNGGMTYDSYEARREADLRAHGYDGEPFNSRDARLGRKVRRLLEEDGA